MQNSIFPKKPFWSLVERNQTDLPPSTPNRRWTLKHTSRRRDAIFRYGKSSEWTRRILGVCRKSIRCRSTNSRRTVRSGLRECCNRADAPIVYGAVDRACATTLRAWHRRRSEALVCSTPEIVFLYDVRPLLIWILLCILLYLGAHYHKRFGR